MNSVWPGALSNVIVPLCALTTAETIARPSPVLPPLRDREVSPRANRSNTSDCSCSGMPGPLSITCSTAVRRFGAQPRRHDGAGAGVDAGVGQQVGQHLVQPGRVAGTTTGSSGRSSSH